MQGEGEPGHTIKLGVLVAASQAIVLRVHLKVGYTKHAQHTALILRRSWFALGANGEDQVALGQNLASM